MAAIAALPATTAPSFPFVAAPSTQPVLSFTSRLSLFPIHVFLSAATIAYDIFLTTAVFACPTSSSSCSPRHIYIWSREKFIG